MASPQPVVVELAVKVLVPQCLMRGQLSYDPADPFAVTLATVGQREVTSWTFSRDLLALGMHATALHKVGHGDIRVWQHPSMLRPLLVLQLSSHDGFAVVALPRSAVGRFLGRSYQAVPRGAEGPLIDWDGVVRRLLEPRRPGPRPRKGE